MHYIKYRHAPFHALMSIMSKLRGRDSPAYMGIFRELANPPVDPADHQMRPQGPSLPSPILSRKEATRLHTLPTLRF